MIAKNREQFVKGCVANGLTEQQAIDFWTMIIKFAGYGFNKSHSTAYALIAYMTAYLKAHYPVEFMAALLSGDIPGRNFKSKDALVEHLEDCERMNIAVVPPNVNASGVDFTVADGQDILRTVGHQRLRRLGRRGDRGRARQRRSVQGRVRFLRAGGYDAVQPKRRWKRSSKPGQWIASAAIARQLSAVLDRALQSGASAAADRKSGQKNMFGGNRGGGSEVACGLAPRYSRVARAGEIGGARRKCWASISRAIRWPNTSGRCGCTARTPPPRFPICPTGLK